MTWNYRRVEVDGNVGLYEVYYDENDQPVYRTQFPIGLDELKGFLPEDLEHVAKALYVSDILEDSVFSQRNDIGDARTSIEVVATIQVPLEFAERIRAGTIQGLSIYSPQDEPPQEESPKTRAEGAFYSIQSSLDSLAGWDVEDLSQSSVLAVLEVVDRLLGELVSN